MTDAELIARLREHEELNISRDGVSSYHTVDVCHIASDRIEALIAERDEALEWLSASQGYIADAVYALDKQEAAEAKLAKAVEALDYCIKAPFSGWTIAQGYARATLAEIKSGVATTPYGLEGETHE